eukprot:Amastigsp_a2276_21.p8 type:complete len:107 gc:universal Amastigsp_a2276_21:1038-718(-)
MGLAEVALVHGHEPRGLARRARGGGGWAEVALVDRDADVRDDIGGKGVDRKVCPEADENREAEPETEPHRVAHPQLDGEPAADRHEKDSDCDNKDACASQPVRGLQ